MYKECVYVHAQWLSGAQFFVNPWTVARQAPPVHGIFQARILEWVAISYSRGSSQPQGLNPASCISWVGLQILYHCYLGSPERKYTMIQFVALKGYIYSNTMYE